MSFRLVNDNNNKADNEEDEKKNALPTASILLVSDNQDAFVKHESRQKELETNLVAVFNSLTASFICEAVCSMLYSTLSRSVPWSITRADRSLKSSAS